MNNPPLKKRSHQLTALAMMIEKECGIVEKPKFPSLWELTSNPRTTKKSVHDAVDMDTSDSMRTDTAIRLPDSLRSLQSLYTVEYLLM
jgi:hypothetical protein